MQFVLALSGRRNLKCTEIFNGGVSIETSLNFTSL